MRHMADKIKDLLYIPINLIHHIEETTVCASESGSGVIAELDCYVTVRGDNWSEQDLRAGFN